MPKTHILNHPGHGQVKGQFFWEKSPFENPGICFVPEHIIRENHTFDELEYIREEWARTNCSAQPEGEGSHMFPDMEKPVLEATPEEESRVDKFLRRWS